MSKGVGRVTGSEVMALVERQKIRVFSTQSGGHKNLVGIDGEMNDAPAKL